MSRSRFYRRALMIGGVCVGGFVVFFIVAWNTTFNDVADRRSAANMHAILLALKVYHADYGRLPPSHILDERGRPKHSWRVLILPYLGEQGLYDRYRFDEPWDSRHNLDVASQVPKHFQCSGTSGDSETCYVAIVGKDTLWDHSDEAVRNRVALAEISSPGPGWTEPRDLSLDDLSKSMLGTGDVPRMAFWSRGGPKVATLDRPLYLPPSASSETVNELVTCGQATSRN